jgi:threonine/homoserine/homoserine lactone efflux protein
MAGLDFFIKGVVLGFSIAAPVGPIGVLCIRRTLGYGMLNGFLSGMGAATADGIYGCIAAFGVTGISVFLLDGQFILRLFGGAFLVYLGYRTFQAVPSQGFKKDKGKGLLGAYASAFLLTMTNPMTIVSFAAVFSALGLGGTGSGNLSSVALVLGVFSGSMSWWFVLSGTVGLLRSRFEQGTLKWVNRASGLVIAGFGLFSLLSI